MLRGRAFFARERQGSGKLANTFRAAPNEPLEGHRMAEFFMPDIGNITATAILGWYAWHTASRTIPDLLAAFREELETSRVECRVEREALRDELSAERIERHDDHRAIVQALHELAERLVAADPKPLPVTQHHSDRRQDV
jgi:hypothetical protein